MKGQKVGKNSFNTEKTAVCIHSYCGTSHDTVVCSIQNAVARRNRADRDYSHLCHKLFFRRIHSRKNRSEKTVSLGAAHRGVVFCCSVSDFPACKAFRTGCYGKRGDNIFHLCRKRNAWRNAELKKCFTLCKNYDILQKIIKAVVSWKRCFPENRSIRRQSDETYQDIKHKRFKRIHEKRRLW